MKPKKIWANLGVDDIDRTRKFYQSLGFKLNGPPTEDIVSFMFGDDDFIINFFEKNKLQANLEGEIADLNQGNEVIFSLSAESKDEFDNWIDEIKRSGGKILFDSNIDRKAFYDENGYYVCVFADPDGHKFNLLYCENL